MSSSVGTLRAKLTLDGKPFERGLNGARGRMASFAKGMARNVALAGAAMTAAAAAAGVALGKQSMSFIDQQAKVARTIDSSITGLRALQLAGGDAGASTEVLNKSMQMLGTRLVEAKLKGGAAGDALKRLGLDAETLLEMDGDTRLATIADRVKELGLSSSQTSQFLSDMGIRSKEMSLLLTGGGDAIRAARVEVEALGLGLSEVDAAKVESANDAMSRIKLTTEALGNRLAVMMAPALEAMAKGFTASMREGGFLRDMLDRISSAFGALGSVVSFVRSNVEAFGLALVVLASTRIPALLVSVRAATAGMTLMQAQFIAGAVAARGMAVAAGVARAALALLGGPLGIVLGLATAAAGAFLIFRDNAGEAETASYDAAKGTAELMAQLASLTANSAPEASAAVIALANNNVKLADSSYAAAKAELARRRAYAQGAADNNAPGPVQRNAEMQANDVKLLNRVSAAEKALEQAMNDRNVVSEQIVMTQPVVTKVTTDTGDAAADAADEALKLADAFSGIGSGGAGGGAAGAAAGSVAEVGENVDTLSDKMSGLKSTMGSAFTGLITGAKSLKDTISDLLNKFAELLANSAFESLWSGGMSGGGGGGLSSLFAGFFDGGGNIPSGKFGIAGEFGPEVVRGPAMVTSRADTARLLSGGTSGGAGGSVASHGGSQSVDVAVTVTMDPSTATLGAFVTQTAGQVVSLYDSGSADRTKYHLNNPRRK